MKLPPKDYEFRSKPAWQRLIIMLGGVTMNVVLAFVIYIGMLSIYGEQFLPTSEANRYGIATDSLARSFGFRNGDKILAVNGDFIEDFNKIPLTIILENAKQIEIERDGKKQTLELPENAVAQLVKHDNPLFLSVRIPFIAAAFSEGSVAEAAGMQVGDTILGINGQSMRYFQDFREGIQQYKNKDVIINVKRGADTVNLAMKVPEQGLIGVYPRQQLADFFRFSEKHYNIAQAIPAGMVKTLDGIDGYLKQLKLLFSPEIKAYESVGGFISIGSIFPPEFHWESFWRLTAFLSIMLAVLNLLPIPALDGGHVMFLFYEIIAGRKPNDKFMEVAQIIGMVLLFGLLIFANGNDVVKLFR